MLEDDSKQTNKNRVQLNHEIGALKPNSYGMKLEVDYNEETTQPSHLC